jgi:hypothetical protein
VEQHTSPSLTADLHLLPEHDVPFSNGLIYRRYRSISVDIGLYFGAASVPQSAFGSLLGRGLFLFVEDCLRLEY